jgi:hypothetical protein
MSWLLSLFTGGSSTVYFVAGALLIGAYGGYAVTDNHWEAKIAIANEQAHQHEIAVVENQAKISQETQKDKDELQTRYDGVVNMLRGLHDPSLQTDGNPSFAIPAKGLRLLEPDAEVLAEFAKQCANTELERNDVIQKYNALREDK